MAARQQQIELAGVPGALAQRDQIVKTAGLGFGIFGVIGADAPLLQITEQSPGDARRLPPQPAFMGVAQRGIAAGQIVIGRALIKYLEGEIDPPFPCAHTLVIGQGVTLVAQRQGHVAQHVTRRLAAGARQAVISLDHRLVGLSLKDLLLPLARQGSIFA